MLNVCGINLFEDFRKWAGFGMFLVALKNFESSKSLIGFLGAHLLNIGGSHFHHWPKPSSIRVFHDWVPDINRAGDSPPRWTLWMDAGLQAVTCYSIAKGTLRALATCWRNRHLELYRPIRNAVIHTAIGLYSVQSTIDRFQKMREEMHIFDEWDRFISVGGRKTEILGNENRDRLLNHFHLQNLCQNPQSQRECILQADPRIPDQAQIMLGLKGGFTPTECEEAYSRANPSSYELSHRLKDARDTLCHS